MQKVAVFGNAGGGKSTLSKRLAQLTGLPLVALDLLKYKPGGEAVPHADYKAAHDQLMQQDQWIIDGFGSIDTLWERLEAADTLVYLGMPLLPHYWVPPESWPQDSLRFQGALNSYRTVGLCHKKLASRY